MSIEKPSIYLIQEPYLRNGSPVGIPKGYDAFGEKGSRAMIFAPSSMNLVYSHEFSTLDITVCLINNGPSMTFIVSGYLDIHKEPIHPYLEKLAEYVSLVNGKAILGLDSNSHSVLWNSDESNTRGLQVEEFIMSYDMTVCNQGYKPTFENYRSQTIIDITLTQGQVEITSWRVSENYSFSDHHMIIFNANIAQGKPIKIPKTDWNKFSRLIKLDVNNITSWDINTIEKEADCIVNTMKATLKKCTFYKASKPQQKSWFNDDLQKEKGQVMKLAKAYKTNKTETNESALKCAKKLYLKNCRKAKRQSWMQFCNSIESDKNMYI